MRKIESLVIAALVLGSRTPTASNSATLPWRATSTTAPGITPLSTSALNVAVSLLSRSEDSPTCSGLAVGRLCASTKVTVTRLSTAARNVAFIFIAVLLRWVTVIRHVRRRHASKATGARQGTRTTRKYRPTLTTFDRGSILRFAVGL